MRVASASMGVRDPSSLNQVECSFGLLRGGKLEESMESMDVSRGLTVGAHHEAPYGWIPTEDGEDRAIVGGVTEWC